MRTEVGTVCGSSDACRDQREVRMGVEEPAEDRSSADMRVQIPTEDRGGQCTCEGRYVQRPGKAVDT